MPTVFTDEIVDITKLRSTALLNAAPTPKSVRAVSFRINTFNSFAPMLYNPSETTGSCDSIIYSYSELHIFMYFGKLI